MSAVGPVSPATTVLFDWNGTLVDDSRRAWEAAIAAVDGRLPAGVARPTVTTVAAAWRLPLREFFAELGVIDSELLATEDAWNLEMASRPVAPRPGAIAVLRHLRARSCEVGVVSAASPALLIADLVATGIAGLIDHLVAGAVDKAAVLSSFVASARPQRVVYVGDSEFDIQAAYRAGAVPVALAGGYRPLPSLLAAAPATAAERLEDVAAIVESLAAGADGAV